MNSKSRISHIDFKPRKPGNRGRRLRLHWIVLGLSGITGMGLLLSGHHAEALRIPASALFGSDEPADDDGRRVVRLKLPGTADTAPDSDTPLPAQGRSAAIAAPRLEGVAAVSMVDEDQSGRNAAQEALQALPEETPADAPVVDGNDGTAAAEPPEGPDALSGDWQTLQVRPGDNLAAIFKRAGLTARDVHEVVTAGGEAEKLVRIFPGDELSLELHPDEGLLGVRYPLSETRVLHVRRTGNGYESQVAEVELERRIAHASATIDRSLFAAAIEAGLSDRLVMELAGVFGWDIDFALDIRRGDSFTVVYEELYKDGELVRTGDIVAAEFVNRGDRYRAVRYTDPEGRTDYYAPDGRSMRKAFLRTPVNFTRVSSNFNPQRFHPVLGVKRPHMGTDYAARPGTPIKAAGDGKIIHRGRKGGYGNTVIIQHGTRYTTLYAHMRGFRSGQRVGSRVKQGEIVGYVGTSGLSTGPHLHYEFRVDGVHRDSRTVQLPEAEPIPDQYRADFEREIAPRLAQLDALSGTSLARAPSE